MESPSELVEVQLRSFLLELYAAVRSAYHGRIPLGHHQFTTDEHTSPVGTPRVYSAVGPDAKRTLRGLSIDVRQLPTHLALETTLLALPGVTRLAQGISVTAPAPQATERAAISLLIGAVSERLCRSDDWAIDEEVWPRVWRDFWRCLLYTSPSPRDS